MIMIYKTRDTRPNRIKNKASRDPMLMVSPVQFTFNMSSLVELGCW